MAKSRIAPLTTPVALIVFNRPAQTRRVLERIAQAVPTRLFIIADGPRPTHPGDQALCEEVRAAAAAIDWPCEVRRNYSDVNLGCKRRIASGLDWVFGEVPQAIIVEDDCLPEPSFFPFCGELLERYRDDERVQMIAGNNLTFGKRFTRDSYYFSRWYHVWGWATWARAWRHFDVEMNRWGELRRTDWVEKFLPHPAMPKVARYFFDETHAGRRDTWDYQWVLAGWQRDALAIVPAHNLVTNIGFGGQATSTSHADDPLATLATAPMPFPLRHPRSVEVHEKADFYEWAKLYPGLLPKSRWRRLPGAIKARLRRYLMPART